MANPLSPFEVLVDYEQRSLSHVAGMPEQIEAPGLWRGRSACAWGSTRTEPPMSW